MHRLNASLYRMARGKIRAAFDLGIPRPSRPRNDRQSHMPWPWLPDTVERKLTTELATLSARRLLAGKRLEDEENTVESTDANTHLGTASQDPLAGLRGRLSGRPRPDPVPVEAELRRLALERLDPGLIQPRGRRPAARRSGHRPAKTGG